MTTRTAVRTRLVVLTVLATALAGSGLAREYHVAVRGDDANDGSAARPLQTISAAARRAQPGDVITVHEGVYRERVNPPRGGTSDQNRIVYQAAPGEKVVITGSEPVKGWEEVGGDTWKVTIPNKFFGNFNPYSDRIHGDWFNPKGRQHHTGAVYLNGHWLTEAASHLNEVLQPAGNQPRWFAKVDGAEDADYLLNLTTFTVDHQRISATAFAGKNGELHEADCSEGGKCIGWIRSGSWLKFDRVSFGTGTESISFRAASVTGGGDIEIRLDNADGELLGTCVVADTGDWQKWATFTAKIKPTSGEKAICLVFRSHKSGSDNTTIWAQFPGVNPNNADVEINVRKTVFTPEKTGINYITVRGFTLRNAATNWAPPTAGQIGLISAYWCKGWIIENSDIRYSTCVGVTLGKHGDQWDNTSQNSAEGYIKTIERGLKNGWSKENIGHHIIRNNRISHCEQAGIVGSLGPVFSQVTGNVIHDIHVRRLFTGAEMAGIKFHAAIDTEIRGNHIYRTCRGIWLDWMTQGTRVTRNLLHDNGPSEDLFVEVNHGPFLVDNNIFLSPIALLVNSQGGAYAHNLMVGSVRVAHNERRQTPYHKPHSTEVAGLHGNPSGDDRYYNNLMAGKTSLTPYDPSHLPVFMAGNVFLNGAQPSKHEANPLVQPQFDPGIKLVEQANGVYLEITLDKAWTDKQSRSLVTTEMLGRAKIPDLPYERPGGTPYRLDTDYFGNRRAATNPSPGPFEHPAGKKQTLKVWPINAAGMN